MGFKMSKYIWGKTRYSSIIQEIGEDKMKGIHSPAAMYNLLLRLAGLPEIKPLVPNAARKALNYYKANKAFYDFTAQTIKKTKQPKKNKTKYISPQVFYESREWQELRYKAIKLSDGKCQACGINGKETQIHVDHIKPRSKYPELELVLSNLQILCRPCNLGKSNLDETDWRPDEMKERFLNAIAEPIIP